MIRIDHTDDARIEDFRALREKDLVGRRGLFVAEGEVVLRVLLQSRHVEPVSMLIAEDRLDVLSRLIPDAPAFPIYVAPQPVMDSIVGFHIHRGLLAMGRRRSTPGVHELLQNFPSHCTLVALHGIANHDNIGGIFRNAAAFGVDAVIADATSCDPLYRKAIRVSVGGVFEVPFAKLDAGEDLIEVLRQHEIEPLALSPSGTIRLSELKAPKRVCIILGAEGPGLPQDLMKRCSTVRIPIASTFDSLNVATTSGIILHQLCSPTLE